MESHVSFPLTFSNSFLTHIVHSATMKGLSAGDRFGVGFLARSREVVQLWSWAVEGKCNSFEFEFGFVPGALNHALPKCQTPNSAN